jgi:hypothetical protein
MASWIGQSVPMKGRVVPFVRWGDGVLGYTGFIRHDLYVDGILVTTGYAVRRVAVIGDQRVPLTGFGGIVTRPAHRRQGNLQRWYTYALSQTLDPVSMIFCLQELRRRNEEIGWKMIPGSVSYTQPGGTMSMPEHVLAATWGIAAPSIHIDGLPW